MNRRTESWLGKKCPWYNTAICYKWHGTVFEDFIRNAMIVRYNIMCSITSHDKQQPTYVDYASVGGGKSIPKNPTTTGLQSLRETLNFIDCWLKHFQHNYQVGLILYHEAMIKLFKEIPTIKSKPLRQDKSFSCY